MNRLSSAGMTSPEADARSLKLWEKREYFKDQLRVYGICVNVAIALIITKASEATRGQALNQQNHNTYIKYQSVLKSLDVQALVFDLEPDYECHNIEQSMAYY
ncbi:hypothetical protein N7532_001123 [Penicillium argentinense]|uniref:Uncharacterized protein n=1 Tax=Penicillium argentinense TaxID=1131581 RepID=A0A9W9G1Y2_9EURO|nr:uncharacterized protein N7532_001123 [Penicillium argentinense]KAJ5110588.1 hypothetical protein N7532_001123 [Penicillium argentinense]